MVNFGPRDTVPEKFRERTFFEHNPSVTLMRTTPEECAELGKRVGEQTADELRQQRCDRDMVAAEGDIGHCGRGTGFFTTRKGGCGFI